MPLSSRHRIRITNPGGLWSSSLPRGPETPHKLLSIKRWTWCTVASFSTRRCRSGQTLHSEVRQTNKKQQTKGHLRILSVRNCWQTIVSYHYFMRTYQKINNLLWIFSNNLYTKTLLFETQNLTLSDMINMPTPITGEHGFILYCYLLIYYIILIL